MDSAPVVITVEDSPSPQPAPPRSPPAPASVPISAASTSESFFAMENSDFLWDIQGTPPHASTSSAVEEWSPGEFKPDLQAPNPWTNKLEDFTF